jgi:hypothetical protein
MLAALLVTTAAANAQESFHPKTRVMTAGEMANLINPVNPADPEAGLPLYKRTMMPPAAPTSAFHAIIRNPPPDQHLTPVVMNGGMGGLIGEHTTRFWALGANRRSSRNARRLLVGLHHDYRVRSQGATVLRAGRVPRVSCRPHRRAALPPKLGRHLDHVRQLSG